MPRQRALGVSIILHVLRPRGRSSGSCKWITRPFCATTPNTTSRQARVLPERRPCWLQEGERPHSAEPLRSPYGDRVYRNIGIHAAGTLENLILPDTALEIMLDATNEPD